MVEECMGNLQMVDKAQSPVLLWVKGAMVNGAMLGSMAWIPLKPTAKGFIMCKHQCGTGI
jgi:hypothetical protein